MSSQLWSGFRARFWRGHGCDKQQHAMCEQAVMEVADEQLIVKQFMVWFGGR
jgi:hypothetical protein